MLVVGVLTFIVVTLWLATIAWVAWRLLAYRSASKERMANEKEKDQKHWVSEDPRNEAKVPVMLVRESTLRVLNEHFNDTPYFLLPNTPPAVRIERAWSLRTNGSLRWRVDVLASLLNRDDVDAGGIIVRLRLQQHDDDFLLVGQPVIIENRVLSHRVILGANLAAQ
jgi:hypothetical protein